MMEWRSIFGWGEIGGISGNSVTTFTALTAMVDGAAGISNVKPGDTIESYELQASRAMESIPRGATRVSQARD